MNWNRIKCSIGSALSAVNKYLGEWSKVRQVDENGLLTLERVVNSSKVLLTLGRPISTLLAEGMYTEFEPESDRARAMDKLNQDIHNTTHYIDQIKGLLGHDLQYFVDGDVGSVHRPLDMLEEFYSRITNSLAGVRVRVAHSIKKKCAPLTEFTVLLKLQKIFKDSCQFPTAESQIPYVEIVERIHEIEYGFSAYELGDYTWNRIVFKLKNRIHLLPSEEVKVVLEELSKAVGSSQSSAIKSVQAIIDRSPVSSDIYPEGPYQQLCRLSAKFDGGDQKRKILYNTMHQLSELFVKVLMYSPMCSNISHDGDSKEMDAFAQRTLEMITDISEYSIEWATRALNLHSGAIFFAKNALRKAHGTTISVSSYNSSAEIIRKEFDDRGNEGFAHQVLVTRPMTGYTDFDLLSINRDNHTYIPNFLGTDVHIFRYENTSESQLRVEKANTWLEQTRPKIIEDFKFLTEDEPSGSANTKMEWIEYHSGAMIDTDSFHHGILFSTKSIFTDSALLHVGEATTVGRVGKVELYQYFWLRRDFSYKMYMFV